MFFGLFLLIVAAVVFWCSGYSSNPIVKSVVMSVALTIAIWGVLRIISSFWFLVALVLAVVGYALLKKRSNK